MFPPALLKVSRQCVRRSPPSADMDVSRRGRGIPVWRVLACLIMVLGTAGSFPGAFGTDAVNDREVWRRRIDGLEQAIPESVPDCPLAAPSWAKAHLHLRKARFVLQRYYFGEWSSTMIRRELQAATETLAIVNGDPPPDPRPGRFEAAYWCDLDGSAQPFVGYLPSSYDHRTPHPLVVYLHGYSPLLNIINWSDLSPDLVDAAEQGGFMVVAPFARGNTDFQGIGEQDVMRVIREMQRRYRVDAERIVLAGYSMGGMGAWTLAAHYPHRFAGALIVSGRACYYTWHGVERDALPFYKQAFIDMEFGHALLPNLQHLPILCYHGQNDPLVPVGEARVMAAALRPLNPRFEYLEIEAAEHWIFDRVMRKPQTRRWLASVRRQPPEAFTYATWHPRYHRAHWLSLPAAGRHGLRRQVSVHPVSDAMWEIRAENLGTVWLHPDRLPATMTPDRIRAASGLTVRMATGNTVSPPVSYRGPVKEFFLAPFVFVQAGDAGADDRADLRFADRCREWEQYAQAAPRRARESDLSETRQRDYNLFLFGEPEDSPMIRRVLEQAPILVTATDYEIDGTVIPREGHGLLFVYQSPWNPDRLVAVQSGEPWGQHLSVNHRYDYLPDVIVYDTTADADGSNRARLAGFFDETGALQTETLYRKTTEASATPFQ